MTQELTRQLIALRRNHPAWLLLASRNGPVTVACLKSLLDAQPGGIDLADATETLAHSYAEFANDSEFEFGDDHALTARRELQRWMKLRLIVERDGQVMPTNSLKQAFQFLESLEAKSMTSTASRLATVQQAIETLESKLTKSQAQREQALVKRIQTLESELAAVKTGDFQPLEGAKATEAIREVYQLAISLRADFERVEDSYREADRSLRQRIISEQQNRGDVVDGMLDSHDALVDTPEGQVFDSFYQQLIKSAELDTMKGRLRTILESESCGLALQRKQKSELRLLVSRLLEESQRVIQARARSERDVRGFLKSGLADEQIRVGALLQDIFSAATSVDWTSQKIRRSPSPITPVGVSCPNLPLAERLLIKQVGNDADPDLDFTVDAADPATMDDEFWQAWQALDRAQLFENTMAELEKSEGPFTIGELATALPPDHDLETLSYWLTMARQANVVGEGQRETIDLFDGTDHWRFDTPLAQLDRVVVADLEPENLE